MIDLQMLALALNLLSAARAVPTVIYHPGPGKTGTSAIQSAATRYRDCLATRDRVRYLGTFGLNAPGTRPGNRNPLDPVRYYALAGRGCGRSGDCPKYRETLLEAVRSGLAEGSTVFISEEVAGPPMRALLQDIRSFSYIEVVVSYRRHFALLRSLYRQQHNPGSGRWHSWDVKIPSFPEWYRQKPMRGRTLRQIESWENTVGRVRVFNTHDAEPSLAAAFFCRALPEAPETCRELVRAGAQPLVNPGGPKDAKILVARVAHAAHEHGSGPEDPREAFRAFGRRLNASALPKTDCLSRKETEALLEDSLEEERNLFPFFFAEKGERGLRGEFAAAERAGAFCSEDVADWRSYTVG